MTILELSYLQVTILLNTLTLRQGALNENACIQTISLLSHSSTLKYTTVESSSQH